MDREEFLRQFREALEGKVPEDVIRDNVNYYRSYIESQTAGGKNEGDVLGMLGDPRLLAKTIEESSKFASADGDRGGRTDEFEDYGNNGHEGWYGGRRFKFRVWLRTCAVMAVVIVVLMLVLRAFVYLAPLILTFMAVSFLIRVIIKK